MFDHCIDKIHIEVSADLDDYSVIPRSRAAAIPSTAEIFNQSACQTGTPHRRLSLPSRLVADRLMQVRRSDKLQLSGHATPRVLTRPNYCVCTSRISMVRSCLKLSPHGWLGGKGLL